MYVCTDGKDAEEDETVPDLDTDTGVSNKRITYPLESLLINRATMRRTPVGLLEPVFRD